ncbi:unnamed protein product [Cuscuta europaea]|uniref:Uncharacterized protein n=1 Tax=Cuscuta europaea TaxID=41803 RepID=A0A9P1E7B5_CUSEU|nr:unnamed protein product [Cuscuta europaea]
MDGRNSTEERQVDVDKVIEVMRSKLLESPRYIKKSAGRYDCCIFRVPQGFTNSKDNAGLYHPRTVSIGPYHHGKPHLKEMEEHKWRFLERVIKRTSVGLEEYVEAVRTLETKARESYSEDISITLKDHEFVEMLVLDGCFVVEMFRAFSEVAPFEKDDPFRSMQWIRFSLHDDFLCLENQIPYFVLEKLFTLTKMPGDILKATGVTSTLAVTALTFFNTSGKFGRNPEMIMKSFRGDLRGLHLLDLVRKTYFPKDSRRGQRVPESGVGDIRPQNNVSEINFQTSGDSGAVNFQSISTLRRAGIEVKLNESERTSFLPVGFSRGVISMPMLELNDTMCAFLLNCVAFEQCHEGGDKLVSDYAGFLDRLVDTGEDVDILCEAKVLDHNLATQDEVAAFVGKLGQKAASDLSKSYLKGVFAGVKEHCGIRRHVYLAEVKAKYFSSPWSTMSLCAAGYLLLLTTVQTIFAVMDYFKIEDNLPKKHR